LRLGWIPVDLSEGDSKDSFGCSQARLHWRHGTRRPLKDFGCLRIDSLELVPAAVQNMQF